MSDEDFTMNVVSGICAAASLVTDKKHESVSVFIQREPEDPVIICTLRIATTEEVRQADKAHRDAML